MYQRILFAARLSLLSLFLSLSLVLSACDMDNDVGEDGIEVEQGIGEGEELDEEDEEGED